MDDDQHDYHNFTSPETPSHRLPTLNGTQALKNALKTSRPISTHLPTLDYLLGLQNASSPSRGISRGTVTEVYGPPGVGKTTFGLQLVADVLESAETSESVCWIDTSSNLVRSRLFELIWKQRAPSNEESATANPLQSQFTEEDILGGRLNYLRVNSLPHLLALVVHPLPSFPQSNTALVVIDGLANLILSQASPAPSINNSNRTAEHGDTLMKKAAARRKTLSSSVAVGLSKLAAAKNIAVVILEGVSSVRKDGQKAILQPSLSSPQWNFQISTRIALYRNFWPDLDVKNLSNEQRKQEIEIRDHGLRIAEIEKLGKKEVQTNIVKFIITTVWKFWNLPYHNPNLTNLFLRTAFAKFTMVAGHSITLL